MIQPEPTIVINGVVLNEAQALTVRAALSSWDPGDLGDDEHGRTMQRLYRERLHEVLRIMGTSVNSPDSLDPSSPEILKTFADKICALKRSALCDVDTGGGFGVPSEQHYLLALDALGTAERFMRLAHCHRMRGD